MAALKQARQNLGYMALLRTVNWMLYFSPGLAKCCGLIQATKLEAGIKVLSGFLTQEIVKLCTILGEPQSSPQLTNGSTWGVSSLTKDQSGRRTKIKWGLLTRGHQEQIHPLPSSGQPSWLFRGSWREWEVMICVNIPLCGEGCWKWMSWEIKCVQNDCTDR